MSHAQNRDPYSPSWIGLLTDLPYGKMLVDFGGSLYNLNSRCAGPVMFDPDTGNVSVGDPPYLSSVSEEGDYGYVALAVPTQVPVCEDSQDDCPVEVRNKLVSQILGQTDCGDIILVNRPACGQVNEIQASDLSNQVRFDRATLKNLDDIDNACNATGDVTLFAFYPKTVSTPGGSATCFQPVKMRRLRFKQDQWGKVTGASGDASTSFLMVGKKVGGPDDNPCLELESTDIKLSDVKTAITSPLKWIEVGDPGALLVNFSFTGNSQTLVVTLPSFPTFTTFCRAQLRVNIINQNSSASSSDIALNGLSIAHCGPQSQDIEVFPSRLMPSSVATFLITATGTARTTTVVVYLQGYLHD